jgi:hypothetical protein
MMIAVWLKLKLTDIQLDNWFANKHGFTGYIISALAGSITPFCSCTTIPIFTGMIDSKLRHGWAITFLIASPTINPPAIIIFYALFDIKLTIIYVLVCFTIAIIGGVILSANWWSKYIIDFLMIDDETEKFNIKVVNLQYFNLLKTLVPIILIAALIATFLHEWIPSTELIANIKQNQLFAIPISVVLGGIVYADIPLLIPIGKTLVSKGLDTGLIFSFMMAASGVGLPSIILLTRIFKKELLFAYLITIYILFVLAGFFISWIG